MNIPKSLKILAHEYEIEIDPEMLIAGSSMGLCCSNILKIKVAGGIPKSMQADTILHEIIEALNYQLELGLDHNVISSLSASLLSVIIDNKLEFNNLNTY